MRDAINAGALDLGRELGGERLDRVGDLGRSRLGAVRQIAVAVNQQNAGVAEIFSALTDLSTMMHATMEGLIGRPRRTFADGCLLVRLEKAN